MRPAVSKVEDVLISIAAMALIVFLFVAVAIGMVFAWAFGWPLEDWKKNNEKEN